MNNIRIKKNSSILTALKQMDEIGFKLLIVTHKDLVWYKRIRFNT